MSADRDTGIAIRFVRQFDIVKDQHPYREDGFPSPVDAALFLAMKDGRDLPMSQKVAEALKFIAEKTTSETKP